MSPHEVSGPLQVQHVGHVSYNAMRGEYNMEGVPEEWVSSRWLVGDARQAQSLTILEIACPASLSCEEA